MKWGNISVERYQYIYAIHQSDYSDFDKLCFALCGLTGKTERQLNKISPGKFAILSAQAERLFQSMEQPPSNKINGHRFIHHVKQSTLGQYIEVNHFVKGGTVENLHYLAASICRPQFPYSFIKKRSHSERAQHILSFPFIPVVNTVGVFLQSMEEFNKSYSGLFGIDPEDSEQEEPPPHPFNDKYGWLYSAKKVAEYEGITLEAAFNLPTPRAFNDLAYLKALGQYESELNKQAQTNPNGLQ